MLPGLANVCAEEVAAQGPRFALLHSRTDVAAPACSATFNLKLHLRNEVVRNLA